MSLLSQLAQASTNFNFDTSELEPLTTTTTTTTDAQLTAATLMTFIFITVLFVFTILPQVIVYWKLFTKAGKPGWAALVPIYNLYVETKIAKAPTMYFVLALLPFLSLIGVILITVELAKQYNKPVTVWLALLFPIVALFMVGKTQYIGDGAAATPQPAVPGSAPVPPAAQPTVQAPQDTNQPPQQPPIQPVQ